jgi:hypothetical protein
VVNNKTKSGAGESAVRQASGGLSDEEADSEDDDDEDDIRLAVVSLLSSPTSVDESRLRSDCSK